jgi:hypothetical protein
MKSRVRYTSLSATAGCFVCNGSIAIWFSNNGMALAARHHDSTGHQTWCDQVISVKYGRDADAASKEKPQK